MKLYKKMVRPYALEAACQGMTSDKTPLANWMDEDEKTESLEKEMEQKCKEIDPMSTLRWEEKYEVVCTPLVMGGDSKLYQMTTDKFNSLAGRLIPKEIVVDKRVFTEIVTIYTFSFDFLPGDVIEVLGINPRTGEYWVRKEGQYAVGGFPGYLIDRYTKPYQGEQE